LEGCIRHKHYREPSATADDRHVWAKIVLTTIRDMELPMKAFSPEIRDILGLQWSCFSAKVADIIDKYCK
jgi:hypothetical protein